MKKLTISTRAQAMKIAKLHPESKVMKYDNGKYQWHGSQNHYVGREETVCQEVLALWVERRQDSDGAFARVMCVTTR